MSMKRTILRNMAKNALKDMGVGNVNKKMHYRYGDKNTMPGREEIAKLKHTPIGRANLAKIYREHPTLWWSVLFGKKQKEAEKATSKMNTIRLIRRHPDKVRTRPIDCTGRVVKEVVQ